MGLKDGKFRKRKVGGGGRGGGIMTHKYWFTVRGYFAASLFVCRQTGLINRKKTGSYRGDRHVTSTSYILYTIQGQCPEITECRILFQNLK